MTDLAKLLRKLRGDKTLREAAKLTGLSFGHIANLENGIDSRNQKEIKPTPMVLQKLATAYNFPYSELLKIAGYIDEPESTDLPETMTLITKLKQLPPADIRLITIMVDELLSRLQNRLKV